MSRIFWVATLSALTLGPPRNVSDLHCEVAGVIVDQFLSNLGKSRA